MKRFLILIVLLLVIGTVAYFALNRTDSADGTSPVIAGAPSNADPVARGEYLARAADCIACHTVPETGKPFAGGLPFKLPFQPPDMSLRKIPRRRQGTPARHCHPRDPIRLQPQQIPLRALMPHEQQRHRPRPDLQHLGCRRRRRFFAETKK